MHTNMMHPCIKGKGNLRDLRKTQVLTLGERIKHARVEILKLNQTEFSDRMGVSQSNVSRWEANTLKPEPEYLLKLSGMLGGKTEGLYFLEAAGVPSGYLEGDASFPEGVVPTEIWSLAGDEARRGVVYAPLLRDPAAAGTPRVIEPDQIETMIPVSRGCATPGSALVAMRIRGESMSPVLEDGYIVIVDTAQRDPKRLRGKMVAARYENEVTVKWLREVKSRFLLVPQRTSPRFDLQELDPKEGWAIVGKIIQWIGYPPPSRK